ncbi:alpha/beta hydrolase [Caldimonas brevitalea]|uniref:Phospholipase/Carboxylesterase n=1 Tax=Caldimonas brevitalea TaxID=413882 RepID=A0A0G3BDL1_9BURK|nr:alpha/beta fold hydrolase [Caldimonas brevitalea]AKJ27499.1 phospholipase/Carboxylesterase [Caldimonas brevitalea]
MSGSDLPGFSPLLRSAGEHPLHYRVRPACPGPAAARPLALLLHGAGADESSLLPLAQRLPSHVHVVVVRAPRRMPRGGYFWYPVHFRRDDAEINLQQVEWAQTRLLQFVEQLPRHCPFDLRQLYLLGFSQGGAVASTFALSHPGRVRGLALLASRLLSHLEPVAPRDDLATLRLFIAHGRDDDVLPIEHAERAAQALRACRAAVVWRSYDGVGHAPAGVMFDDTAAWLRGHCPPPARVDAAA